MGVDNKTPVYTSEYGNNNIKLDPTSTITNKVVSTNGVSIKSNATSIRESYPNNRADISITTIVSNYNPNYMRNVIFAVVVKNNGPNISENVIASYWLNHTHFKWISDDGNSSYNHLTGIWSVGILKNNTKKTLHIVAQIIKSNTTIKNYATYKSSSTFDPNTLNNHDGITLVVPPAADISLTQTASKYYPNYLHHTIITIRIKNNGPNTAENVIVNYWLDPNILRYISDNGHGSYNYKNGILTIGTLKSGSNITLQIQTKVMLFNTVIRNIAGYQANTFDPNLKNNRVGIKLTVPALTINSLASSLAIGTKSNYNKAVNIFNWVRDYLDYSFYYNTRYGADGTLKVMKGNCADLSHLIVALARATGLSARYKYGTCYFFKSNEWIGHVWVNIHVNGPRGVRWYSADASNNINDFDVIRNWNTTNYILKGIYSTLPF